MTTRKKVQIKFFPTKVMKKSLQLQSKSMDKVSDVQRKKKKEEFPTFKKK